MRGTHKEFFVVGSEATWDGEDNCDKFLRVINVFDDPRHATQLSYKKILETNL